MLVIEFGKILETYSSAEEIKRDLSANPGNFIFITKIAMARHYSDLAFECLEAAFIGQQLAKFAAPVGVKKKPGTQYDTVIEFEFSAPDSGALSQLIFNYGRARAEEDDEEYHAYMGDFLEYREQLDKIKHAFPELVDDYYVNYVNGEYYEHDPVDNEDFFKAEFQQFPERKFGFTKSAFSNTINQEFYASTQSVIIPASSDFNLILKEYAGIENIEFVKADFFALGNITYLMANGFIIHFPFDAFIKAKHCAGEALALKDEPSIQEGGWMDGFLSFNRSLSQYNEKENQKGYPDDLSEELISAERTSVLSPGEYDLTAFPEVMCFYISAYGEQILVKDGAYSYFFFGTDKLTMKELGFLGNRLSVLFNATANLAGIHVEIKCPWEQLTDETFEDLCFDIIYYNPAFNNTTIRKMGKTRSRDGGRDIEVFTHSRPGKPAKKYIFQCKYQKPGSSLTASKVQDISDTVTQYQASGYGIMTNVVIDATLYDKLDGISRNLNIETEDYSVYKLERILACYSQIKQRYFNYNGA